MAYTPHTWSDNETITAAKLNAMEQGIANAGGGKYDPYDFVISCNGNTGNYTAIKGTFASIKEMLINEELVTGFYQRLYVSGTWVEAMHSTTIWTQYNPSSDAIFIRVTYVYGGGTGTDTIVWNASGVYYDD